MKMRNRYYYFRASNNIFSRIVVNGLPANTKMLLTPEVTHCTQLITHNGAVNYSFGVLNSLISLAEPKV